MSVYFSVYFDAVWPRISQDEELIQQWSFFFERLNQLAEKDFAKTMTWFSTQDLERYWLLPKDSPLMRYWLRAFFKRRPVTALRGITSAWNNYVCEKNLITPVTVLSAAALSHQEQYSVREYLKTRLQKVNIVWDVNPKLLGGVQCVIKDMLIDLSMYGALQKMAKAFDIRGLK